MTSTPWKPMRPPDDPLDDERGQGRGQRRIERRVDDVRRHHPGQIGVARERQQVGVEMVRLDGRQRQMAVDAGAAMARRVLADRLHAGGEQPVGEGAAEAGDHGGILGEGAVADDVVRARDPTGRAPAPRPC